MGDDDYCPQCFECDGECINGENGTLVCESCGHVYTDEEWDEKNDPTIDKALQAFVDYQIKTSEINSFEELASELNAIRELLVDIASKLEITIPSMEEDK